MRCITLIEKAEGLYKFYKLETGSVNSSSNIFHGLCEKHKVYDFFIDQIWILDFNLKLFKIQMLEMSLGGIQIV